MFPLDETMSKSILLVLEYRRDVDSEMEAFSGQFKDCVAGPARHPPAGAAAGPANISTAEAEAKAEELLDVLLLLSFFCAPVRHGSR